MDLAGYRIVQESLTNALKHGDGIADVVIGYRPALVTLTVDTPAGDARREPSAARGTLSGVERGLSGTREATPGADRARPGIRGTPTGAEPALPGAGAGIIGMRERAALVGGVCEAGPYGDGWRVHAELPTGEIS